MVSIHCPKLNVHQKGPGGSCNIQKLREKCIKLQKEAIPLSLDRFLNCFSFTIRNLYVRDERGRSLLHEACLNEDISIIKYIINQAPELVDSGDHKEMTPLCISLAESKQLSVQYLLKYGACVKEGGGFLGSPLHIAIRNLNQSAVQKILESGENPNKPDGKGNTPLHYAIEAMDNNFECGRKLAQLLLEHKALPNIENREKWTPLHCAVKKMIIRQLPGF